MARGDEKYLPARDRGPVRAYIRDVVDSRPHLIGLFMPLALVVVASVLVPVPAVQQYMSLFSLAMLMTMIAEGVYLGLTITRKVAGEVPERRRERAGHRLVLVHARQPAAAAADAQAAGAARGEPVAGNVLVLGGTRSGKSGYAEGLLPADAPVRYLATARRWPGDAEWDARIAAHRARRPAGLDDGRGAGRAGAAARRRAGAPLLVDDLATWLTGVLDDAGAWERPDGPGGGRRAGGRAGRRGGRGAAGGWCWCRPRSGWGSCRRPGPGGCSATSWAR